MSLAASAGWLAALVLGLAGVVWQRWVASRTEAVLRACHELRGPLTAVRLGLDLGLRGHQLSVAQLRAIGAELGRAALAVDDLAHSGGRHQPLDEVELVDLGALLTDSVLAWRASAVAAGVELMLSEPLASVLVRGQRRRLSQATGNLIANAIEHGGRVVSVGLSVHADYVQIIVRDDGPGLPDSVLALAQRAGRRQGTRGRGLAIVTGIAALHEGRLHSLAAERGAHLALELPFAGPDARPVAR